MSIPSPCYLLAQTETVSSQAISLHWTITRFPISRLVNKGPVGVPIRYLVFKLMKNGPSAITRSLIFKLMNKGPVGVLCLIHIQIVVNFPLRNVGCIACPFDFLSFQEVSIDMITQCRTNNIIFSQGFKRIVKS